MIVNQNKLRKRLKWLWENRTRPADSVGVEPTRWRYIPRAFSRNGPGWGVFDRLQGKFITDADVVSMPIELLKTATHLS